MAEQEITFNLLTMTARAARMDAALAEWLRERGYSDEDVRRLMRSYRTRVEEAWVAEGWLPR